MANPHDPYAPDEDSPTLLDLLNEHMNREDT